MENNDDMDENIHFTEEKESGDHALNLKFTIGYSSNMIGAIHNLTLGDKRVTFSLYLLGNFFSFRTYWCYI